MKAYKYITTHKEYLNLNFNTIFTIYTKFDALTDLSVRVIFVSGAPPHSLCWNYKPLNKRGVNCLMTDFHKFWTRMNINAESQKKQSDKSINKTVLI